MVAKSIAKMYTNIHKPTDYTFGPATMSARISPVPGAVAVCQEYA